MLAADRVGDLLHVKQAAREELLIQEPAARVARVGTGFMEEIILLVVVVGLADMQVPGVWEELQRAGILPLAVQRLQAAAAAGVAQAQLLLPADNGLVQRAAAALDYLDKEAVVLVAALFVIKQLVARVVAVASLG